jgi:phosphoenolpyruvate phosphomutase
MEKSAALQAQLKSTSPAFLVEAHNSLSAKILEDIGFKGIWTSYRGPSGALGSTCLDEATSPRVLDEAGLMAMITRIPIVLDDNTKNGELDHVRCLAKKLCRLAIAGLCIEGTPYLQHELDSPRRAINCACEEFCGRIKAAKDGQTDRDFCVVAGLGSLVGSASISDALFRSEACCEAGADSIFLSSNANETDALFAFAEKWANRAPLIVMSAAGYQPAIAKFEEVGVSAVIWLPKWDLTHSRSGVPSEIGIG